MSLSITETDKHTKKIGVTPINNCDISDFAFFHYQFLGFNFLCRNTGNTLTKSQVFWRNPRAAFNMAKSLELPAQYDLVEYKPLTAPKTK